MEKSVPSAKKKFSIRDIMTIAAMMVICFIIMMVMSSLTLPFPLVYLYGSAGIDGFICAVFFLVAANRVNKHGLLFAWAGIYGLIQGVMGYMFLFPYFLAVGLIAELSCLVKTPTATRSELVSAGRLTAWVTLSAVLFPSGGHGTAIRQWLWRVDLPLKP